MTNPNIAIIVSLFNRNITQALQSGAIQQLKEQNVSISENSIFLVPGAVEIPLVAKVLASQKKYDALICLGAVIRGETQHYDYVCWQVSYGCQKVALEHTIPIVFGILTTENEQQAYDRCGGIHGNKGKDCADTALHMIEIIRSIQHNDNSKKQKITPIYNTYNQGTIDQL